QCRTPHLSFSFPYTTLFRSTDIAIALSDHYNWDAGSIVADVQTGRRVSMQAAYNDTARDFHEMVSFGKAAIRWFSQNWPGLPYPDRKSTRLNSSHVSISYAV